MFFPFFFFFTLIAVYLYIECFPRLPFHVSLLWGFFFYLAPESDPGISFALQHHSGDEGLVVAHVDTGQVASLLLAGRLSCVPGRWLLHQLVAVLVPGDVTIRAGVLGWWWRINGAC